tara:strand:- start:5997 stop:7439 length:1443 start_codon:yes stop_codon:yes gene_type:complete
MAKIIDPDQLNQGTEVDFLSGSRLIRLNYAGNLTGGNTNGVSWQALYSFIKEEWKNDDNLVKFPFPVVSITTEQFELINGWDLSGSLADISASQYLVRDGGWAVVNSNGNNTEEWMNLTTLGQFQAGTDNAYYYQTSSGDIPLTIFAGPVNQGIRLYASASVETPTSTFDYRDFYKVYLREQGKTYGFYDLLAEQNLTALTYRKFALPLTNATDLNIAASDATITTTTPYTGMSISYFTSSFQRTIGGTARDFKVLIDGNSGTKQQIYEFVQKQLRSGSGYDIDSGDNFANVTGSVAEELLQFVGDTLKTKFQSSVGGDAGITGGVYIDNFLAIDTNNLTFVDDTDTERTFPFVAAGTILFNTNLQNDGDSIYKLFFTNDDAGDNTGRDFGTQNALIIESNNGDPITGSVATSASRAFDYDYDGNIQRGSDSSGSDVPFTGVALGLGTAQYVVTTGTWTRSTANAVNFVAALERNYSNPA